MSSSILNDILLGLSNKDFNQLADVRMPIWTLIFNGSIGRCRLIIERNGRRRCRMSLIHSGTQVTVHSDSDNPDDIAAMLVSQGLVSAREARKIANQLIHPGSGNE